MAQVTLDGTTYDSADQEGYGYLDPVRGFFAILAAFVSHAAARVTDMQTLLTSAESSNGVLPGAAGNVLTSNGTAWESQALPAATDEKVAVQDEGASIGTGALNFTGAGVAVGAMVGGVIPVTIPGAQFIGAHAHRAAVQSIPDATWTAITQDTEAKDSHGFWVVGAPTRFTVPSGQDGTYEANGIIAYAANGTGVRGAAIYKNGVRLTYNAVASAGAAFTTSVQIVSPPLDLVAGDYVELFGLQTSGGFLDTNGAELRTGLTLKKIGGA